MNKFKSANHGLQSEEKQNQAALTAIYTDLGQIALKKREAVKKYPDLLDCLKKIENLDAEIDGIRKKMDDEIIREEQIKNLNAEIQELRNQLRQKEEEKAESQEQIGRQAFLLHKEERLSGFSCEPVFKNLILELEKLNTYEVELSNNEASLRPATILDRMLKRGKKAYIKGSQNRQTRNINKQYQEAGKKLLREPRDLEKELPELLQTLTACKDAEQAGLKINQKIEEKKLAITHAQTAAKAAAKQRHGWRFSSRPETQINKLKELKLKFMAEMGELCFSRHPGAVKQAGNANSLIKRCEFHVAEKKRLKQERENQARDQEIEKLNRQIAKNAQKIENWSHQIRELKSKKIVLLEENQYLEKEIDQIKDAKKNQEQPPEFPTPPAD